MEKRLTASDEWQKTSNQIFWGEIAPCEHVVQFYEDDDNFLDLLAGFIHAGITDDESVVVIATGDHLERLNGKLAILGLNADRLTSDGQYIPLDAAETLERFMVNDWPDENLFMNVITEVIQTAKRRGRRVRAFGEMVAILWSRGQIGATVRLEQLWNKFCENEAFPLFCAYPKDGFAPDASASLKHICTAHTKMIAGVDGLTNDIFYKEISFHKEGS